MSRFDRIDHNHFRNFYRGSGNGFETIRAGSSPFSHTDGDTEIDANLFENCDGEAEIISVKCHGVAVRSNTFRDSRGMVTYRNGNNGVAEGNWFLRPSGKRGVEGIRFYGSGHRIAHNHFEGLTGAAIIIRTPATSSSARAAGATCTPARYGNYDPAAGEVGGGVQHDARCAVAISIGDTRAEYPLPPRDIAIANNRLIASKVEELSKPERFTWTDNADTPPESPAPDRALSAADVGPRAIREPSSRTNSSRH